MTWAERERRTATLVRACWNAVLRTGTGIEPQAVTGLIRLCWITVIRGKGLNAETSPIATTWRALDEIFGTQVEAAAPHWDDEVALRDAGVPKRIVALAAAPTGIINFRRSMRAAAMDWVAANRAQLVELFRAASELTRAEDADRLSLARRVEGLPSIPLARGTGDPANIVTPVLSCLDPANRFPIVGGGNADARRQLGLRGAALHEVVAALLALIPWRQHGIKDSRDLDVRLFQANIREEEWLTTAKFRIERAESARNRRVRPTLSLLSDEKLEVQTKAQRLRYRQTHNAITNEVLARLGDRAHRPHPDEPKFDVLVDPLSSREPFLLIEVKPDLEHAPSLRMAIGQLLSYQYQLKGKVSGRLRLAAMAAREPSRAVIDFLGSINIDALWLERTGDVWVGGTDAAVKVLTGAG